LISLEKLAITVYQEQNSNVITYFANDGKIDLFYGNQVDEEKEKARQIVKDNSWEECIVKAENTAFFKGAIRFMFTNADGNYDWNLFENRFNKAQEYFDKSGVSPKYKENAQLICTLISLFTKWKQCWGNNKVKIGNGVEVWGDIIRNANLLQPLAKLLNLTAIPLEIQNYQSTIEKFEDGAEAIEKLVHEDMCNNRLINKAISVMGEGILLNWRWEQFALYRPNANADWKNMLLEMCVIRSFLV
jgi:hypothetical protein